jgi:hypothetical protein
VFVKSIGTYVLPAAPPLCVVSTTTRSADVAQVASAPVPPEAVADADAPADAACEPLPEVPLLALELFPDELPDFTCELLDEPQPASSAVAIAAAATVPAIGSADREIEIIKKCPFVCAGAAPANSADTPEGTQVKTRK